MEKQIRRAIAVPLDEEIDGDTKEDGLAPITPEQIENEKDIRKRDYKIEKFTLTLENINDIVILEDRRLISEDQVRKIHGALLEKKNPIGILIINRINSKNRLIDGNHRIEAIKRFFEYKNAYSIVKIDCTLKVYENLTPGEERQVYLNEAKRRNEGLDDRLNMFKSNLTIWKLLNDPLNPFPCEVTIYPTVNKLKLKIILNAIASIRRGPDREFGSAHILKDEVIDLANDITYDEYILFKEFMTLFVKTYGKIEKTNFFSKSHYIIPLFDIYAKNIKYKNEESFNARFARVIGRTDIMSYINLGNRTAMIKIRELMLNHMNKTFSKRAFE